MLAANPSFTMLLRLRLPLFRTLVLVALAVSIAQLADHISGAGAFCDFEDGCEKVTNSPYGKPLGIPLSVVGAAGFSVVFILSLIPSVWSVRLVRVCGLLAGAAGLALLLIQFTVLHQFCHLCVIVDSCSLGLAAIAALGLPEPVPVNKYRLLGWVMVASVAVLIPICWTASVVPDSAPEPVRAHWRDGEINVVEVSDFECKFCRAADPVIREVLKHHKVRFVRVACPMPLHQKGAVAAKAFVAARQQGKGEEMAKLLFESESLSREDSSLTRADCLELAKKLNLDIKRYEQAMNDEGSDNEIDQNTKWVMRLKVSVPSIWVQDQLIAGVPTAQALDEAIRNARPAGK